ncbi:MAG: hypothetical protein AVO35_04605 [Candidatus Aegiribacteria sp. MLS_C]|nr:MAG: hypothetical protein AVO35_04605 [Candidatus Aegiribacteria sp. MLS_C]
MSYLSGIWLVVLGILAAPNLIISRKPEAKEIIAKMVPYQGWFGAISAVYGVIDIIRFIGRLDWFEYIPVGMITFIAGAVVTLALGLLLGIGVIKSFVSSDEAKAKMDEMIAKLAPKQGTLGLLGIIIGLWIIVYRLLDLAL